MSPAWMVLTWVALGPDSSGGGGSTPPRVLEDSEFECLDDDDGTPKFLPGPESTLPFDHSVLEAVPGGRWWVYGDSLADLAPVVLVDVSTAAELTVGPWDPTGPNEGLTEPDIYLRVFEAGSGPHEFVPQVFEARFMNELTVPADLPAGVYELRTVESGEVLRALTVIDGTPMAHTAESLTIDQTARRLRACSAVCQLESHELSWIPVLEIDYVGDDALLDLHVETVCGFGNAETTVSGWFPLTGPSTSEVLVDDRREGVERSCDTIVTRAVVIDPDTGAALLVLAGDATPLSIGGYVAPSPMYVDEAGNTLTLEACGYVTGTTTECACVGAGAGGLPRSGAALLFGALAFVLRRRR